MRTRLAVTVLLTGALCAQPAKNADAKISSIYPFSAQHGKTYEAVIRGTNLGSARSLVFRDAELHGRVLRVEQAPDAADTPPANRAQLVHVEITIGAGAKAAAHRLRVLTDQGLSNEIALRVSAEPVAVESGDARNIAHFPATVTGRIADSGETDDYWFDAKAGETLAFEAFSGNELLFDPSLTLYEPSGSWFDPKRLNQLAFNDEPLNFPGLSRNPILTHRFARAGRYCVRVEGFSGQGGPDGVYELRISPGAAPQPELRPALRAEWEEHELTRSLSDDWMQRVASRGTATPPPRPESYRAVLEGSAELPAMKIPGVVEGVIAKPGETHAIRINVDKAQELVIEIETPEATMPLFTPVVRLLEPGGAEIVGNVYTRLNNNNLKMMKAIKAKTAFPLMAPGLYTLQIHELTTDHAGTDYRYRVLIRQQIPHLGKLIVQQERINLERGSTRPVSIRMEREEGFESIVAVQLENLPAGVTALTGVENPAERPTLPNAGKPERYQPRVQPASVLLAAGADAPLLESPAYVRVIARPVRDGQLGEPIAATEIPVVVLEKK